MENRIVSHYRIMEHLGAGGMGEIFLAEDLKLGRKVALKFLSEESSSDPDRIARLEREARAASSLNHPNILVVYEIGQENGVYYIACEYIEGEPLRDVLARGSLSSSRTAEIGIQVLSALEVAHAAGVVHRDIKPENIMVRPDGFVKVLDFGLAKMQTKEQVSELATTVIRTEPGLLIGTLPYMSPEQVRGFELDARSDLFSLGVMLYEMLTSKRPFDGPTTGDILAAILQSEPLWRGLPLEWQPVLRRALEKRIEDRYESARQMGLALHEIKQSLISDAGSAVMPLPRLSQLTFAETVEESPEWEPGGSSLFFCRDLGGFRGIFKKHLHTGDETQLTADRHDSIHPACSPDGRRLLFVRARDEGARLEPGDVFGWHGGAADIWSLDLQKGTRTKVIENAYNPSFSPDGKLIAFDASWAGPRRIWIADSNGRNPQQVTSDTSEEIVHIRPRWSPSGSCLVFQNIERTKFDIRVVNLITRELSWLTDDSIQDLHPVWAPSGSAVYFSSYRSGGINLWRIPVTQDGQRLGGPQQVTAGPGQDVEPAITNDGKQVAFSTLKQNAEIWKLPVRPDGFPAGLPEAVIASTREDSRGAWSPDGRRIAFNSDRSGDMNIWIHSLSDRSSRQITRGAGGDFQASWSPDGEDIAFFSSRSGSPDIWVVNGSTGRMTQLTADDAININPFYSPDGNWIAYQSDQSGRMEVWLMDRSGAHARQLTDSGVRGHFLRWSADGRHVYYFCPYGDSGLWQVDIETGQAARVCAVQGGAHISCSPGQDLIMDVVGHKTLWVSPLRKGGPVKVFEFEDASVRIDYPLWSPDGGWILFDRFHPKGGDIWRLQISNN